MPLSRLLYTSRSRLPDGAGPVGEQVARIAQGSRVRNRAAGLSGCLLHIDGHFIQVLEGDLAKIETVFERICCDFRHEQVRLIDLVSARASLFSDWDMALMTGEGVSIALRSELEEIRLLSGINARVATERLRECLMLGEGVSPQLAA